MLHPHCCGSQTLHKQGPLPRAGGTFLLYPEPPTALGRRMRIPWGFQPHRCCTSSQGLGRGLGAEGRSSWDSNSTRPTQELCPAEDF